MMYRLSMVQALSLWKDLEDAFRGEHGFGGHVAEIYVYRLMSRSPLVEKQLSSNVLTAIGKSETNKAIKDANESLHNLLVHFAEEREALVEVQQYVDNSMKFIELGDWLKTFGESHRWHVQVRPRNPTKPLDQAGLKHLFDITSDEAKPRGNWDIQITDRLKERRLDTCAPIVFKVEDAAGQRVVRVYAAKEST